MTWSLPLLHVAQFPHLIVSVDWRVVVAACFVALLTIQRLWFPGDVRRHLRRLVARTGAARLLMTAALFFAASPSILPYDHLFFHSDNSAAEESVHAAHCHVTPGSCADAPLTVGPGQLVFNSPLIVEPSMLSVAVQVTTTTLAGRTDAPDLRPPIT